MGKKELIEVIAAKNDISKKDAAEVYEFAFSTLYDAILSEDEVSLPGIGKFKKVTRAARNARNPRTGETISVPSHNVVKFAPASQLKSQI